ncbi:hypothetical protein HYFRA_00009203 [Hymenoscyphus fraxineus]|uniref:AB hydrolase-1 domain-containing protein n=1 Tax=Hymenoscyphus fraxineus TaxID=746836 RepID=A0A9N9KV82_9HELO|nr:hypothetical protein HYFRA_00009203 [Hymenoscyphus fraxineus]
MNSETHSIPVITREALEFEQSQWSSGSVHNDPFYSMVQSPALATLPPGKLLKLERTTDTSLYSLPAATALSRIVYQSKTLSGENVPVAAFILWPHAPRSTNDGYQVVAWAHGTSGISPNSAPSHTKNLWQHFNGPYALALQGHVVVGTDYAGMGVSVTAAGKPIKFEYLGFPSHANDVIYSVQAAQNAFPELSKSFVVTGHSQGGGTAWAVAQRQFHEPVEGYLGSIAFSPITDFTAEPEPFGSIMGAAATPAIEAAFPDFNRADVLTEVAVVRLGLIQEADGGLATALTLLAGIQLTKPGWTENSSVKKFLSVTSNGRKPISGPLLVIHGDLDTRVSFEVAEEAVEETAMMFPDADIEFLHLEGVNHESAMVSVQWEWMDWIQRRFEGVPTEKGLRRKVVKAVRPVEAYQRDVNWYIAPSTNFWETP